MTRIPAALILLSAGAWAPLAAAAESSTAPTVVASAEDRGLRLVVPVGGTNELRGDLAGDGHLLVVTWSAQAAGDASGSLQPVTISDDTGHMLWTSPVTPETGLSLAFGKGDQAVSLPEALIDMDGDGRLELLAPAISGEAEPKRYRIFRWTGSALKLASVQSLSGSGGMDTLFSWQPRADVSQYWIDQWLTPRGDSSAEAKIVRRDDNGNQVSGVAVLTREGPRYVRDAWAQRPARVKSP